MLSKNVICYLRNVVREKYIDNLRDDPYYGAPVHGVIALNQKLSEVLADVENLGDKINGLSCAPASLSTYPHFINSQEIVYSDAIIDDCMETIDDLLVLASLALKYKKSFDSSL
jgi:hypothetical protein